jgi:hypothetical protein
VVPGVWCELVVASDPVAGLGQRNRNNPPQTGQFLHESVGPEVRIWVGRLGTRVRISL